MVSVHQEPPHSPPLLKSCTLIVPRCSEIFITANNIIKSVDMELCCDEIMKIPKMAIIMLILIIVVMVIKMAIILPTGQWYAPSAVINDAWYCMVLHGIALYCIVLHGIAW